MTVDHKVLADIEVRVIGHDNVIADANGQRIDLQALLLWLKEDLTREQWLALAADAWDAARP